MSLTEDRIKTPPPGNATTQTIMSAVTDAVSIEERGDPEGMMTINMGPQHPSTHGVLRVVLDLDGDPIAGADPDRSQHEVERGGPARDGQRPQVGAEVGRHLLLERVQIGPHRRQPVGFECFGDERLFTAAHVRHRQVNAFGQHGLESGRPVVPRAGSMPAAAQSPATVGKRLPMRRPRAPRQSRKTSAPRPCAWKMARATTSRGARSPPLMPAMTGSPY